MVGYKLIGKNKLIPRVTIEGRHREWAKVDPTNPYVNGGVEIVYTDFDAVDCVIQPMRGKAARDQTNKLMEEGSRDYDSYTVYTSTLIFSAREGHPEMADQLLLKDSRGEMTWFTAMKVDPYPSSGVDRFRVYLIAVPVGTEGGM